MTVRKIKVKNGNHKCSWCAERAVLRAFMWGKVSCKDHHAELIVWDIKAQAPDYSDAQFYGKY